MVLEYKPRAPLAATGQIGHHGKNDEVVKSLAMRFFGLTEEGITHRTRCDGILQQL